MAGIAMMVASIADDKAIAERKAAEIREKEAAEKAKKEEEAKKAEKDRLAKEKMERVKAGIEAEKRKRKEEEKKKQAERAKRAKKAQGSSGLYGNLPDADPEKDAAALAKAQENSKGVTLKLKPLPPQDSTKVIFLDIDGVLRPMVRGGYQAMMVDGEYAMKADTSDFMSTAMLALRHIVEHTGAVVVLSSEWRRDLVMREAVDLIMKDYEMRSAVSWTRTDIERAMGTENPFAAFVERRAREISDWLRNNPNIKQWVVLDDINMSMADTDPQRVVGTHRMTERTVQTHNQAGLTMVNAKAAVQILQGEKIPPQILEVQPNVGLC